MAPFFHNLLYSEQFGNMKENSILLASVFCSPRPDVFAYRWSVFVSGYLVFIFTSFILSTDSTICRGRQKSNACTKKYTPNTLEKSILLVFVCVSLTFVVLVCYALCMVKQERWLSIAVGKILADRRQELGLTQSSVATKLRIQRTSLSNIESGKQVLLLDVFYNLCDILKLSPTRVLEKASHSQDPLTELANIVNNIDNK